MSRRITIFSEVWDGFGGGFPRVERRSIVLPSCEGVCDSRHWSSHERPLYAAQGHNYLSLPSGRTNTPKQANTVNPHNLLVVPQSPPPHVRPASTAFQNDELNSRNRLKPPRPLSGITQGKYVHPQTPSSLTEGSSDARRSCSRSRLARADHAALASWAAARRCSCTYEEQRLSNTPQVS